jgi:GTP pyrophosphokinase
MVGAIVNNNIVPLDYKLKDNDIIKINTNKNSAGPSREWINMAYTSQAKNKIKAFFNKIDKEGYMKKGEEVLKEDLRKKKIVFNDFLSPENLDKIIKELKFSGIEELYINLGNGKVTTTNILNIVTGDNISKVDLILKKATTASEIIAPIIKNDIVVEGIDEIKVNVASCCKPIPGDRIIGYITKGNGITVHRAVCPNVSELEERLIDVKWNEQINKKYPTALLIRADNNKNVLLDIISKTANSDVTVQSINSMNCKEGFLFEITILVDSKERLMKFMNDLLLISSVGDVERIIK